MNILYIYGWNSNPASDTAKSLREFFPGHNIVSVGYFQKKPAEAIEFFDSFISNKNVNAIVASSFGAFIAIHTTHSIYRFLINPCLRPSLEIPKIEAVSQDFVSECEHIENRKKIVDDEDIRFTTAFFAANDELFSYRAEYLNQGYFKFFDIEKEYHRLSNNGKAFVFEEIKKSLRIY